MSWQHDAVVLRLCTALEDAGVFGACPAQSEGHICDLLAKLPMPVVFEVKRNAEAVDYYCAIGQLLTYRQLFSDEPALRNALLVAVMPEGGSPAMPNILKNLGIILLNYRGVGAAATFPGLGDCLRSLRKKRSA
jgi:hypothetical protein